MYFPTKEKIENGFCMENENVYHKLILFCFQIEGKLRIIPTINTVISGNNIYMNTNIHKQGNKQQYSSLVFSMAMSS